MKNVPKTNAALVKKVNKIAKQVNQDKPEVKFYTTADAPETSLWLSNGYNYDISNVVGGYTSQERVGQKIRMLKLTGKLYFNSGSNTLIRYQVVVNKAPVGQLCNYAFVNDSLNLLANYNMDNKAQYRVLRDVTFPVNPNDPNKFHKFSINLNGMLQEFTTNTSSTTIRNEIRLILLSDDASEELGTPYAFSTKLTYTDV